MFLISLLAAADAPTPRVEDTWNLADFYPTVEAWEKEVATTDAAIPGIGACRGQLGAKLRPCLDQKFGLEKTVYRLAVYAHSHSDEDTRDDTWLGRAGRVDVLATRLDEASSFFGPEIQALGGPKVEAAIAADPQLAPYDHYLRSLLKDAPHTLDPAGEALLAASATVRDAPGRVRTVLVGAEIPWPTVTLSDGSSVRLDPTHYAAARETPVREDRVKVFTTFLGTLQAYAGTLGTTLDANVQGHWFEARARHYPTSVAAAMDSDHLPPEIYDRLVARTNANLPTLHRYLALRAKMVGISDPSYYDLYLPVVALDRSWTIDEAKAKTIECTKILGPEYTATLQTGFANRWMDVYPKEGKVGGAYMEGAGYDVHPVVLMNYTGEYDSVSTLAHEWGHALHSVLSTRAQPFAKADYATFIAEIASTFNEALLLDTMLKSAKTDDEKLFYLGNALEGMRGTYFRQAQFGEFELAMHKRVESGEPLTGDWLSATYLDITRRYYGHAQGVTRVDDPVAYEWAYIPHFYYNFYVYQYATSIAASSLLAEDVMAKKPGALDRYLGLLKAGGSDDPYVLLKKAGVDMATDAPYDAVAARMNRIMDQMEAILAKKKPVK